MTFAVPPASPSPKGSRLEEGNTTETPEDEQVHVAAHDTVSPGCDRSAENEKIIRVAARIGFHGHRRHQAQMLFQEAADRGRSWRRQVNLAS